MRTVGRVHIDPGFGQGQPAYIEPGLLLGSRFIKGLDNVSTLQAIGLGSFVSSTITGGMVLYYLLERMRTGEPALPQQPEVQA